MEILYQSIYSCIDNIVLPVGKTLVPSLGFSVIIALITIISKIAGIYTFIDYRGAILAVCVLCIQCFYERRSNSDLLRIYSATRLRVEEAKRWKERPSGSIHSNGDSAGCQSSDDQARGKSGTGVQDGTGGLIGSLIDSAEFVGYVEHHGQDETDGSGWSDDTENRSV